MEFFVSGLRFCSMMGIRLVYKMYECMKSMKLWKFKEITREFHKCINSAIFQVLFRDRGYQFGGAKYTILSESRDRPTFHNFR